MTQTTLAEKVKEQRIKKGWSQELLAENAGLSLRTIQRIEQRNTIPRGDTLNKLCATLEIDIEKITKSTASGDKSYLANLHFSALGFLLFPILGILFPLLIWGVNKEKMENTKAVKDLLNFQITWNIVLFVIYFSFNQWISYRINTSDVISPSLITQAYPYLYITIGFLYLYNLLFIIYNIFQLKSTIKVNYQPRINFIQ